MLVGFSGKSKGLPAETFTVIFGCNDRDLVPAELFDLHLNMVTDSEAGILATVAGMIATPYSFHFDLVIGEYQRHLISGFMAKECRLHSFDFVWVNSGTDSGDKYSRCGGTFVFCLLCPPCVAASASIKEGNW